MPPVHGPPTDLAAADADLVLPDHRLRLLGEIGDRRGLRALRDQRAAAVRTRRLRHRHRKRRLAQGLRRWRRAVGAVSLARLAPRPIGARRWCLAAEWRRLPPPASGASLQAFQLRTQLGDDRLQFGIAPLQSGDPLDHRAGVQGLDRAGLIHAPNFTRNLDPLRRLPLIKYVRYLHSCCVPAALPCRSDRTMGGPPRAGAGARSEAGRPAWRECPREAHFGSFAATVTAATTMPLPCGTGRPSSRSASMWEAIASGASWSTSSSVSLNEAAMEYGYFCPVATLFGGVDDQDELH